MTESLEQLCKQHPAGYATAHTKEVIPEEPWVSLDDYTILKKRYDRIYKALNDIVKHYKYISGDITTIAEVIANKALKNE